MNATVSVPATAKKTVAKVVKRCGAQKTVAQRTGRRTDRSTGQHDRPEDGDQDRAHQRAGEIHGADRRAQMLGRNGVLQSDLGQRRGRPKSDADQEQNDLEVQRDSCRPKSQRENRTDTEQRQQSGKSL